MSHVDVSGQKESALPSSLRRFDASRGTCWTRMLREKSASSSRMSAVEALLERKVRRTWRWPSHASPLPFETNEPDSSRNERRSFCPIWLRRHLDLEVGQVRCPEESCEAAGVRAGHG